MKNTMVKKPFYKKWWLWLTVIVVIVFLYFLFKPQERLFLEIDKNVTTLTEKNTATFAFKTNKGNKYTVTELANNKKKSTKIAESGDETLTLSNAGKYKLTVYLKGEKESIIFLVKPLKLKFADLTGDTEPFIRSKNLK